MFYKRCNRETSLLLLTIVRHTLEHLDHYENDASVYHYPALISRESLQPIDGSCFLSAPKGDALVRKGMLFKVLATPRSYFYTPAPSLYASLKEEGMREYLQKIHDDPLISSIYDNLLLLDMFARGWEHLMQRAGPSGVFRNINVLNSTLRSFPLSRSALLIQSEKNQ